MKDDEKLPALVKVVEWPSWRDGAAFGLIVGALIGFALGLWAAMRIAA